MEAPDLVVELRAALDKRRGEWKRIADGAGVSHSWISQFVRNKIPNPGYATLKRLRGELIGADGAPDPAPTPADAAAHG